VNKINEFYQKSQKICNTNGFDSLAVCAHACLETANLERVIGKNNYWGIKTPQYSKWDGLVAEVCTSEYLEKIENETELDAKSRAANIFKKRIFHIKTEIINSTSYWKISLIQTFRDWNTIPEAINWYCSFIEKNYKEAYINRSNPVQYFKSLVSGKIKYATNPNYAVECIDRYKYLKKIF